MNYRHAYHAGNFADVLKHAVLARILVYLTSKSTPLAYVDTHAGIGRYDLARDEASRTGEWRGGIGRLAPDPAGLLAPYLGAVGPRDDEGRPATYPGSPALAQALLRPIDRLVLSELHPEDAGQLRISLGRDKRAHVLVQDGYRTLNACVPPPERRGIVLVDPPFEDRTEFERMADAVLAAHRKWPTGTYMLWYPVKDDAAVAGFLRRLRTALAGTDTLEIELAADRHPSRMGLRGSGLFLINPPYVLAGEVTTLLPHLCATFGGSGAPAWHWRADGGA